MSFPEAAALEIDQEPASPPPSPVPGETIYLELTATNLHRVRLATELVQHPGALVHEVKSRLIPGPAKRITVVVSDRRLSIGEKTYRLEHLVSLSSAAHAKSVGCALILIGMGALMFAVTACSGMVLSAWGEGPSPTSFFFALAVIGIGVALYRAAKDHYGLHISVSSGEVDGLISADRDTIAQIYDAIYQALMQRADLPSEPRE